MCGYIPGQSYLEETVLATPCQAKGRPFKMDLEHCLSKSVPLKAPKSHKSRPLGRTESISLSLQTPAVSGFDSCGNTNRESPERTTVHCLYVNRVSNSGFAPVLISASGGHSWTRAQNLAVFRLLPPCHPHACHRQGLRISLSE